MALITSTARNEHAALYIAMTNTAPGATSLSELVAAAESGKSLAEVATMITSKAAYNTNFPGLMTGQEFANKMASILLPASTPAGASTWATSWVLASLNAGKTRAQVFAEAVKALTTNTNPDFADSVTQLNNKVDVAIYRSVTKAEPTDSAAAIASVTQNAASVVTAKTAVDNSATGAIFTLTTGTDNLVGDAGSNTFNGASTTLTAGDKIDGGAGDDILNLTVTGTTPAFTLSGVETVNLTASPNPATVSLTGATGIKTINNASSANGAALTVSDLANVVNVTLTGSQAATTINYTTAAVAGTTDASTLTLAGTSAGATFTGNGVETMTIASTSAANTLTSVTNTSLKSLVITGDKDLTITNAIGGTVIATVNASAATGNVSLTTGAGAGGTALTGVTVTGPTTAGLTVTTGANKDVVTLGSGNNTVVTAAGDDTITSGTGTNTITPGAGNDTITLTGGTDTIRYAEAGSANADTINGFTTKSVIALNLGAAQTTTAAASAGTFGVVQTGATSPVLPGVGGTGTATAIVLQAINPNATATVGTVAAGSTVLALNGAFTDGTAAGVITALGTTATTGITTTATGKFVLVTYSVGNIAQIWSYAGDTTSNSDIDAAELSLVATLNGVAQNSITASNFASYLTPAASTTAVSNDGQTINVNTQLNTIQSAANANGHFLTAANDTINVSVGMLPTGATTATMGLTVIDPSSTDADVLNATVLNAAWDNGTIISGIETVNLNMLVADAALAMTSILPGTKTLNVTGGQNLTVTGILSGTAFGLGAGYTGTLDITPPTAPTAAMTLNLNGTVGTSAATSPTFTVTGGNVITALTVNANANTTLNTNTNTSQFATATLNGAGNVTIFDTAANFAAANIVATTPAYTGTLTFRPSTSATMDFSAGGVVSGLKVIDFTDIAANGVTGTTITVPAQTGGHTLTIIDAPTTARDSAIVDLIVVQQGSNLNDVVTFNFGSVLSAISLGGAITAATTETVNINYSPTTAGTAFSVANITTASALGTQTVNVSGTAAFTLGTVTADVLNTSGVGSTGSIASATLANGTSGVIFTGGAGAATIIGSTAADSFTGGAGNDSFRNTASGANVTAADKMTGGGGNDTYILNGDSAQAAVAVATAYTAVPNVTDFSVSGANGVDILALSATNTNYAGAATGFAAGVAVAAAGATGIMSQAVNGGAIAYVAGTDLIKFTTATAVTGTLQDLFNAAIGTGTITGLGAGTEIFFSVFDSTNLKMLVGLVDAGAGVNTSVETGDVVTLIGSFDMTSANYTAFAAANLAIIAA